MKRILILCIYLLSSSFIFSQNSLEAKSILDEVSTKMNAYENMFIGFSQVLINEEAGILEGDEPPIRGEINLMGEKYNLKYLGNLFIYDANKLYIINHEEKEISISEGDLSADDGFIYPSKLFSFYKEGYNFEMGKLENINGRKIQFVSLNPIDSDSDIIKVQLGIDAKTKHIYKLIQTGSNGAKTSFTITTFKINQPISEDLFKFNKQKYLDQQYTID
ncbi:outer membrane lipoprotein carrier protein LolA [Polaribacter sp.]|uniref:LolA family protein n=1 Tax=Polaribacter sp. TaxID=1920175 RepID=UPI0025E8D798|nr:outer membrane lipoprotein carrier protein LolA [Polaribacter sp.]